MSTIRLAALWRRDTQELRLRAEDQALPMAPWA